jgi:hypothetical protein
MTFEIGQKLLYVPTSRGSHPEIVTITKIGRVWVECGPYTHFRKGDLPVLTKDGRGEIFESEAAYRQYRERVALWGALLSKIRYLHAPPVHVSTDDVRQIAGLLKIELDPSP